MEWAYTCVFCLEDGRQELAVAAEITTNGMTLNLCGRHLNATCEVRARLGIGFDQPLPTPGALGGVFKRLTASTEPLPAQIH